MISGGKSDGVTEWSETYFIDGVRNSVRYRRGKEGEGRIRWKETIKNGNFVDKAYYCPQRNRTKLGAYVIQWFQPASLVSITKSLFLWVMPWVSPEPDVWTRVESPISQSRTLILKGDPVISWPWRRTWMRCSPVRRGVNEIPWKSDQGVIYGFRYRYLFVKIQKGFLASSDSSKSCAEHGYRST